MEYKEYVDKYIDQESTSDVGGIPIYVFRTPDNNYGLFPYPDKAYTLKFDAYIKPTALSAATDAPSIPEQFSQVIVDGATAYGYQYRGEAQQYGINFTRFEEGIKHMQSLFINRDFSICAVNISCLTHKGTEYLFSRQERKTWLMKHNLALLYLPVKVV